jgi:hypothetical protein
MIQTGHLDEMTAYAPKGYHLAARSMSTGRRFHISGNRESVQKSHQ